MEYIWYISVGVGTFAVLIFRKKIINGIKKVTGLQRGGSR